MISTSSGYGEFREFLAIIDFASGFRSARSRVTDNVVRGWDRLRSSRAGSIGRSDMTLDERRPRDRGTKGRALDDVALAEVRELLGDRARRRDLLIEFLHLLQDSYGFLSAAHLRALAEDM